MALEAIKGKLRAIKKDVLVHNMDLGEQKTAGGIIISSDDGKAHGVKPRWCQVYAVGPEQTEFHVGQWLFVEHGRWTRKIKIDDGTGEHKVQKIELSSVLCVADEKPNDVYIGTEFAHGAGMDIKPEDFIR